MKHVPLPVTITAIPVMLSLRCLFAGCLTAVSLASATAQSCGPKPAALVATGPNIFSEQQEQWLGDAMADLIESRYRPVRDPAESAYLQRIADRLLAVLPPTSIHFRLLLIDSPEINGFSLAGGRVYITRKLVANARSEDEVASVIGHEMGHILSHQIAVETTADFKRLLNVTSVTDRADIYAKLLQLEDKSARDKHPIDINSDEKQDQADRVGVYATAAAGYRPQAFSEFWDRSFFVGGKTGNGLMDFFGGTTPTQKRLRLMRNMTAALPLGCGGTAAPDAAAFNQWKALVVANQSAAPEATVADSVKPVPDGIKLTPPLRLGIDRLRFSPDGKYVLAQDEISIFVLTHQPFAELFRIEADRANEAYFTPDSTGITFSTRTLHTERWDIANRKLAEAHEINFPRTCLDSFLSPDGRSLACVSFGESSVFDSNNLGGCVGLTSFYLCPTYFQFDLLDVETATSLFTQKNWFRPTFWAVHRLIDNAITERRSTLLPRSFSPDAKRLLVGPIDAKLAFDLETRTPLKISTDLNARVGSIYAFVGKDIAGVNSENTEDSGLFTFPEGKRIRTMNLPFSEMEGVTSGNYVLVRHIKQFSVGIADLDVQSVVAGANTPAMDMLGKTFISETTAGSLDLGALGSQTHERVGLSVSPLGRTQSVVLSPDGQYLALSARSRSAIWDLTTGKQVMLMKPFRGGVWKDRKLYAAMHDDSKDDEDANDKSKKDKDRNKNIDFLVVVDPVTKGAQKLNETVAADRRVLFDMALEWKPLSGKAVQLVAHSATDTGIRWTKDFPNGTEGVTLSAGNGDVILATYVNRGTAGSVVHSDPSLAAQLKIVEHKDAALLITDLAATTGEQKQRVVIEAPVGFRDADELNRVADLLYLSFDDGNRTIVYSMTTGKQQRQFFGGLLAADEASGRVATYNRRDELTLLTADGAETKHLSLGSPIRFATFVKGGAELLVLTADQQVRRIPL